MSYFLKFYPTFKLPSINVCCCRLFWGSGVDKKVKKGCTESGGEDPGVEQKICPVYAFDIEILEEDNQEAYKSR